MKKPKKKATTSNWPNCNLQTDGYNQACDDWEKYLKEVWENGWDALLACQSGKYFTKEPNSKYVKIVYGEGHTPSNKGRDNLWKRSKYNPERKLKEV